jgi:hypothetical protein
MLQLHSTFGNLKSFTAFAEEIKRLPPTLIDTVHKINLDLHNNEWLPKAKLAACNELLRSVKALETAMDTLSPEPTLEWLEKTNEVIRQRREQVQRSLDKYETVQDLPKHSHQWEHAWGLASKWGWYILPLFTQAPLFVLAALAILGGCKSMGGFLPRRLVYREHFEYLILTLAMLAVASFYLDFSTLDFSISTFLEDNPQLLFFLLTTLVQMCTSSYLLRAVGVVFAAQVVYNQEYEGVKYMLLGWVSEPSWSVLPPNILSKALSTAQAGVECLNYLVHLSPSYLYDQLKHHLLSPMPVLVDAPLQLFYESAASFAVRSKEHDFYVELHKLALIRWNELSLWSLTVLVNAVHSFNVWRQQNALCTALVSPLIAFVHRGAVLQAWWHSQIVWTALVTPLLTPFHTLFKKTHEWYLVTMTVVRSHAVSEEDRTNSKTLLLRLASKTDFFNSNMTLKDKKQCSALHTQNPLKLIPTDTNLAIPGEYLQMS